MPRQVLAIRVVGACVLISLPFVIRRSLEIDGEFAPGHRLSLWWKWGSLVAIPTWVALRSSRAARASSDVLTGGDWLLVWALWLTAAWSAFSVYVELSAGLCWGY